MEVLAALFLLVAYVVADAIAQGKLNLLARAYIPPTEQTTLNTPLHGLYPLCYAMVVGFVAVVLGWQWLAIGLLLRVGAFDPVLNATKSDPLFAVGSSALTDKLLRSLAGDKAPLLSGVLRAGALAGAGLLVWYAAA